MYDFSRIKGNELVVSSLQNQIQYNKVSHAYIFEGAAGSGKKLIAYTFAKTLLCEEEGTSPCGKCISCRSFEDLNNPDIIFVKPGKTISLGVDDIREQVLSTVSIKPYQYKYKIYIIDKAHKLTPGAQNALLKTIEEPPAYGVFLLLTNNINSFLETIISRCVVKKISPLPNGMVKKYLTENNIDEKTAEISAVYSGGSIGTALKLSSDAEFIALRDEITSIFSDIQYKNVKFVFKAFKILEKYKEDIQIVLEMMHLFLRDALIYKSSQDETLLYEKGKVNLIQAFCSKMSLKAIIEGIEALTEAQNNLKYNANFILAMEVMLMKMAGL